MTSPESFLHTTHRTITWFNKSQQRDELELASPFQRNPVWTEAQKAYLIDTVLLGLPIPELYMVDTVGTGGEERHIVVDGQQRVRACLEFIVGSYRLDGSEINSRWKGLYFEGLSPEEKQAIFSYKFVVRVLPNMADEDLRRIFARLNRNVVALNEQELRNATYWGPFINTIQWMADDDPFWAASGIFSAKEHRRMLDHEFISELAIAYLHGAQNKKDKLDYYYQLYEVEFEMKDDLMANFMKVTSEIAQILPDITSTRWKKKSDFYTLFLALSSKVEKLPLASEERVRIGNNIRKLGNEVNSLSRVEEEHWDHYAPDVIKYFRAVSRAASDKASRISRSEAFDAFVFGQGALQLPLASI